MDVNPDAVADSFRRLGVERLLHGHTHRPAIHRFRLDGKPVTRTVLGDWQPERGSAVRLGDDGVIELLTICTDSARRIRLDSVDREPEPAH